ncbi:5-hydroxytryptamine receptor 1F-like [Saccostrea cucullata]|uniref:5-hydroxytryptamine receptor 1F-like n=1 Tax=Saccostrea cuccullata TaxID=36930 RepID=UPI002ED228F2
MATVAFRYGMGACLALIGLLSVILNCILFFTCVKRKRLRKPPQFFLISLAVVDILAVLGWLSLTVVSLFNDGWILPSWVCKAQEYFMSFWLFLNTHSFVLLAFDRCLLFVRPSKHSEIFIDTVVFIMILALWFFDGLLSAFPYFGWGTVSYFSNQFQCAMNHEKNIRETNFVTAMCFGIPITLCMGMYLFIFIMIRKIKKQEDDNGALIVERNRNAIGDSYSQRLRNLQYKFQNAGTRAIKPNIGKKFTYTEDGYIHDDSSDDENTNDVQKGIEKQKVQQKKVYHMAKNDTLLTKTYVIMTFSTFFLWLPYVVVTYIFLKDRFANISDELVFVVIFLCHCTTLIKPVVYVTYNSHFRKHVVKLFRRKRNKQIDSNASNSQTDGQGYDNVAMQQ